MYEGHGAVHRPVDSRGIHVFSLQGAVAGAPYLCRQHSGDVLRDLGQVRKVQGGSYPIRLGGLEFRAAQARVYVCLGPQARPEKCLYRVS